MEFKPDNNQIKITGTLCEPFEHIPRHHNICYLLP